MRTIALPTKSNHKSLAIVPTYTPKRNKKKITNHWQSFVCVNNCMPQKFKIYLQSFAHTNGGTPENKINKWLALVHTYHPKTIQLHVPFNNFSHIHSSKNESKHTSLAINQSRMRTQYFHLLLYVWTNLETIGTHRTLNLGAMCKRLWCNAVYFICCLELLDHNYYNHTLLLVLCLLVLWLLVLH